MKSYLKKSFEKFKQDALSKLFYDLLKWLIPTTILFALSKVLPDSTSLGQILSTKIRISVYAALLIVLSLLILAILIITVIFSKKYNSLKKSSVIDELTGLKNHKAFREYLVENIENLMNSNKTFSIILIDVDDFKRFNTDYSPNIADSILGKVGELLGNDKRATDEVFRQNLRGDEFVVVTNETNLNDAYKAAERKRVLIHETTFIVGQDSYKLSVCCGVTEYKKGKDDFSTITDRANKALVEAKAQYKKNNTKTII